jgi:two-component system cell cycle sensor histidine kinase/response regulator CckA
MWALSAASGVFVRCGPSWVLRWTGITRGNNAVSYTILVVDDEESIRRLVCRSLTAQGFRALEAATPAAACDLVENNATVDLLVTDIRMPEMSGPALARRLAERHPQLPVIFMSGYRPPDEIDRRNPRVRFLAKPFQVAVFLRTVAELLDAGAQMPAAQTDSL